MKNIRDYTPDKYENEKEYTLIEPHIYRTMEVRSDNGISLEGISDKEVEKALREMNDWKKGEGREEEFLYMDYNGIRYYKDSDDNDEDYTIFKEEDLKPIFVTSIVFEPEPELGENDPSNPLVSQYPLCDILDEYMVYCWDDYKTENEQDKVNSYVEFASPDINDIIKLREAIIGKRVYNVQEGEFVNLKIE